MKNIFHLQHQLICRNKHTLGNKEMLLHKYSHVDNSQNYHYKYCSINPINSKFLQGASREQEGVVMGISTINSFLSYLST